MIYVSYGMPKSASSFAFLLTQSVANQKYNQQEIIQKLPQGMQSAFHDDFNEKVDAIDAAVADSDLFVVKTHNHLDSNMREKIMSGRMMASITFRDPYDVVVSLLDAGKRERLKVPDSQRPYFAEIVTVDDALSLIPNYLYGAESWLKHATELPNTIVIKYDQLKDDPYSVAERLADQIGMEGDTSSIVNQFVRDKTKIWEYNVGKSGRGHSEIDLSPDNVIVQFMDRFMESYWHIA